MPDAASRSSQFIQHLPRSAHRLRSFLSSSAFRHHSATRKDRQCLSRLPEEILQNVFVHLDSLATIRQFSRTCKQFHAITTRPSCIAAWLLKRFGPQFAIYYSIIAFPHRCDEELILSLVHMDARISRYLLQMLVAVYGKEMPASSSSLAIFTTAAQRVPYTGYTMLIGEGFKLYGDAFSSYDGNDLVLFMNALQASLSITHSSHADPMLNPTSSQSSFYEKDQKGWKDFIDEYAVIPVPILTTLLFSLRTLLRLADKEKAYFDKLAPIFDFDPLARRYLWEAVMIFLFDVAFTTSEKRKIEYQSRLAALSHVFSSRPPCLLKSVQDSDLFCDVIVTFLGKYPPGYCSRDTTSTMLSLLVTHVRPSFSIQDALVSTLDNTLMRPDIRDGIAYFLSKNTRYS